MIYGNTVNDNTTRSKILWWILKGDTLCKKRAVAVRKHHLLCLEHVYKSFTRKLLSFVLLI